MGRPLRTEQANRDLLEIWVHIAENSLEAADRTIETIGATCQTIADAPGMGRRREEFAPDLRSFPVGKYLVFYRPVEEASRSSVSCMGRVI